MVRCHFCGRDIKGMPFVCRRCGKSFCSHHRLPENHNCTGKGKISKQFTSSRSTKNRYNKPIREKKEEPTVRLRPQKRSNSNKKPRKEKNGIGFFFVVIVVVGLFIVFKYPAEIVELSSSFQIEETVPTPFQTLAPSHSSYVNLDNPTLVNPPKITATTTSNPTNSFKNAPISRSYRYYNNNAAHSIVFTTYGGLADYLSKEDHTYRVDPDKEIIMELLENPYQDEYLEPILNSIKRSSGISDDQAKVAISIVQHIPYDWTKYYGITTDWLYPYETIHLNKGVCSDKSILLAYLLNKLGYDTVLFEFSNHMAVGVKCDPMYDFYDTGYAFVETTRPTIITHIPDTYLGGFQISSNPKIIHLNGGIKELDVSAEFRDSNEYKKLLSMGPVLDQYNYQKWQSLSTKYDLQYEN